MSGVIPNCGCDERAALRTCLKDGPNNGRQFFNCQSQKCKFFQSLDGKPWNPKTSNPTNPMTGSHDLNDLTLKLAKNSATCLEGLQESQRLLTRLKKQEKKLTS